MTELQEKIKKITQTITDKNLLLCKLKRTQKDLEKPKAPKFPYRFIAKEDSIILGTFIIGLDYPTDWDELPENYKGRTAFDEADLRQIISGLQTLLGDK